MNIDAAIAKLREAEGDPQQLDLATIEIVLASRDPSLRIAVEAAAIPHWFTDDILCRLLAIDKETASRYSTGLQMLPMIEPFRARGAWNVHESARLALRSSLGEKNPRYFRELSRRAIRCFDGDEPYMRIERVYHRLVVSPEEAEAELASLTDEWLDGKHEPLQALGVALDELPHVRSIAKSIQDRLPSSRSADDLISKGIVGLADEIGRYYSSKDATEEFFERLELHNLLGEALERLPHLEKTVISLYYREEMTLREIAKILELHESRISQLKSQAVLRLRRYLQKRWPLKGQA